MQGRKDGLATCKPELHRHTNLRVHLDRIFDLAGNLLDLGDELVLGALASVAATRSRHGVRRVSTGLI